MSLLTLSRCLSFEEEQGLHFARPASPPAGSSTAAAAVAPPPGGVAGGSRHRSVQHLKEYVSQLGAASSAGSDALVEMPSGFEGLVQVLLLTKRDELSAERGWLSAAQPQQPTLPLSCMSAAAQDAGLREQMHMVQLLEQALQEASQRAASVEAACRGQPQEASEQDLGKESMVQGGTCGGLERAMQQERSRVRRAWQLQEALQGPQLAAACADGSIVHAGSADGSQHAGVELTPAQERLLAALLQGDDSSGADAPGNPFAQHDSQLAAIDAQLAALCGGDGGSEALSLQTAAASAGAPGLHENSGYSCGSSAEAEDDDEVASMDGHLMAFKEARQRIRIIDQALLALAAQHGNRGA